MNRRTTNLTRVVGMTAVFGMAAAAFTAAPAFAAEVERTTSVEQATTVKEAKRAVDKYDLNRDNLAIGGYDPVAYFPEGDPKKKGAAIKGKKSITHTHGGVTYRFSSTANRDLFKAQPEKYEPAYGGWCAYAASKESYTSPSPKNWKVQDGRLFLFYKGAFTDTLKSWNKEGPDKLEVQADRFWNNETGETARTPENEYGKKTDG